MGKLRRFALGGLVIVFALSLMVGSADGHCMEEYFIVWCGYQCDYFGSGWWACSAPNQDRCCYELIGEFSCGEGDINYCPECQPGGCGF